MVHFATIECIKNEMDEVEAEAAQWRAEVRLGQQGMAQVGVGIAQFSLGATFDSMGVALEHDCLHEDTMHVASCVGLRRGISWL